MIHMTCHATQSSHALELSPYLWPPCSMNDSGIQSLPYKTIDPHFLLLDIITMKHVLQDA
jgi:hypothetical protein